MALFGIYGRHEIKDCPWNNLETGKAVLAAHNRDMKTILPKYKIKSIVKQYHSALEHTFLWVFDAEDSHLLQDFAVDTGIASFNEVKIVPLIEFKDVAEGVKKIHNLN